jgi:hypothetical protein
MADCLGITEPACPPCQAFAIALETTCIYRPADDSYNVCLHRNWPTQFVEWLGRIYEDDVQ